jgi:hypothetical protein
MKQLMIAGSVFRVATVLERLCKTYEKRGVWYSAMPQTGSSDTWRLPRGTNPTRVPLRILTDHVAAEGCETSIFTRAVDLLPSPANEDHPMPIFTVQGTHEDVLAAIAHQDATHAQSQEPSVDDGHVPVKPTRKTHTDNVDNEWMYVLQQAQSNDPNAAVNGAFCAIAKGEELTNASILVATAGAGGNSFQKYASDRLRALNDLRGVRGDEGSGASMKGKYVPRAALVSALGQYYETAVCSSVEE